MLCFVMMPKKDTFITSCIKFLKIFFSIAVNKALAALAFFL